MKYSFKIYLLYFGLILIINYSLFCEDNIFEKHNLNVGRFITIQLDNGDLISGKIVDFLTDNTHGEGISISSEIGVATVFEYQIKNIIKEENNYRHNYRSILLPTAYPIEDDHFLGISELALINAGFGIGKYLSFMAAHSIIPGANYDSQIFYLNGKATLFNDYIDKNLDKFAIATGINLARIGKEDLIWNAYICASLDFGTTIISANLFYKFGGKNLYDYRYRDYLWTYAYSDGAFGISFAIDKELSEKGLHIFAEIINSDFTDYKKTLILSGLRFSNHRFAADLGIGLFAGTPLPIMQFFWTPF